jgi:natural product biosynthesis luciferase-like monooxygenase protein
MFFAADGDGAGTHRCLLEAARRADELGFSFVSTPERHFHRFGGAFPNPAVTSAAVAAVTRRVQVRAGSLVSPLHEPARVVEDFAVVDAISGGRVGIALASGWNVNDFALAPEGYDGRRDRVLQDVGTLRRLWREGSWPARTPTGSDVVLPLHPRPVQPELPLWLTVSRTPATFAAAGTLGTGVLTHLENQDLDTLAENVATYRRARAAAGHGAGRVTVMVHTHVAPTRQEALDRAVPGLQAYLESAVDLDAGSVAAGGTLSGRRDSRGVLAHRDTVHRLARLGVQRYLDGLSLIGSVADAEAVALRLAAVGVDEIACLVDFVPDTAAVLDGLEHLDAVRRRCAAPPVLAVG